MTACFIVLAHRNPAQVARLAARLAPHHVFVHVDARTRTSVHDAFVAALTPMAHVTMLRRFRSAWASWGAVDAVVEGLKVAMQRGGWTHVMHITGQDYPLCTPSEMDDFFAKNVEASFVDHWPLPSPRWGSDGGMYRLRYRHWPLYGRRLIVPFARELPGDLAFYGGSAYWCLTPRTTKALLDFMTARDDVVTAIMNGPEAATVRNRSLTHFRWPHPEAKHPVDLHAVDADELIDTRIGASSIDDQTGHLFARKFNLAKGSALFDLIDRHLDARSGAASDMPAIATTGRQGLLANTPAPDERRRQAPTRVV
jgi:hypothetical protein